MTAPVYVMPPALTVHGPSETHPNEVAELLRQLITLQQEQVSVLKAQQAQQKTQDGNERWRAFLSRWAAEFPGIGAACKQAIPALERAYLTLVRELTDKLVADPDALTDEFVLSEFLDRYGMKLGQIGNLMSQLAPLADASGKRKGRRGEGVKGFERVKGEGVKVRKTTPRSHSDLEGSHLPAPPSLEPLHHPGPLLHGHRTR